MQEFFKKCYFENNTFSDLYCFIIQASTIAIYIIVDANIRKIFNKSTFPAFISVNKFNRLGLDHFWFTITPKGILPYGYDYSDNRIKNACSKENKLADGNKNSNGNTCGEWIRRWGNADYWYGN